MAGLGEYRRKRDARKTPEPVPVEDALPVGDDNTFVIQEHHASRLHWDVRLERGGVLVSWAVPRGLPTEQGDIRLAVHTEDHPMEYATFEGDIPKGEYGGGRMVIWDRGTYETVKWSDREVAVVLSGSRVQGKYTFFHGGKSDKDWMVRRSEPPQRSDWVALPAVFEPMLASPGALPADDEQWAYEFKWDGVRALARVDGGRLRLFSRKGNDITSTYPELRVLGEELGSTQVWLDGEIVAFRDGRPSFSELQKRMHVTEERLTRRLAVDTPVTYVVFDVLHLDGRSCLDLPYTARRERLVALNLRGPHWNTSPSYPGEGAAVLETAREQELEGIIAKRLGSRYHPGRRASEWLKITDQRFVEVVIGGWRPGEGRRSEVFGSLLVGLPTPEGLRYVGHVGTGFTDHMLKTLTEKLHRLARKTSPFCNDVDRVRGAQWVTPSLVGEVAFLHWTDDGRMRAPTWRGLRADKDPSDLAADPGRWDG
ncbi:non-homologous end-joining DNA ligase [Actinokineospora diospyrosa]|uniref:DNA ligase (ATP) n=1 Tax=Actinokineospora diospyrosa TaxID=103728 RepID=A0ABT1ICY2_9PSEU|nr:non-homologous end-joining DNA ligase [Actinokineospora diospyrosa]MCP2270493.1 bifunctional non-homologous end joining protein LigD [Actinokineospora diospyrosa]